MKEITNWEVQDDVRIYEALNEAYVNNEDVVIPKDLLKEFVQNGCRITICSGVFHKELSY